MDLDPALCRLVKDKIATFGREQILEAVRLTESFPPPGEEPADVVSQVIHDVALHAESLGDWPLCAALYRRALAYPVDGPRIAAGNWYRLGLCQERIGCLREAMESYRRVLSLEQAWPYVAALARAALAGLLTAAEEYEEAAELLARLRTEAPHPEIPAGRTAVELAGCLVRLGRQAEARRTLEDLCAGELTDAFAVEGARLLAGIHEAAGETAAAISCYERIIGSGGAELHLKQAAAARLESLRRPG